MEMRWVDDVCCLAVDERESPRVLVDLDMMCSSMLLLWAMNVSWLTMNSLRAVQLINAKQRNLRCLPIADLCIALPVVGSLSRSEFDRYKAE